MYIYPLDHILNPYYIPVYYYDRIDFENILGEKNIQSLQVMRKDDIVVRLLGLRVGDLIIINRKEPANNLVNGEYSLLKRVA